MPTKSVQGCIYSVFQKHEENANNYPLKMLFLAPTQHAHGKVTCR